MERGWRTIITDGTAQQQRLPAALQSGYINVDEMSQEMLLSFSAHFAEALTYYGLDNRAQGTWEGLFAANEAVVMAHILSYEPKRLEVDFLRHQRGSLPDFADFIYHFAQQFDLWYQRLRHSSLPSGWQLGEQLAALIKENLQRELHGLGEILHYLQPYQERQTADFSQLSDIWEIDIGAANPFPLSTLPRTESPAESRESLRKIFYALLNGLRYLSRQVPAYLQQSLQSQQHDPGVGLFITFLQLYGRAQQRLNQFTSRHLDFYYRTILRGVARERKAHSLHLICEPLAPGQRLIIEKETPFSAGNDPEGKAWRYLNEEQVRVDDAEVRSLHTLCLARDPLLSPEHEFSYISAIKHQEIPCSTFAKAGSWRDSWPLFGAEGHGSATLTSQHAESGFALSSNGLLLKEGERRLEVAIAMSLPEDISLQFELMLLEDVESAAQCFKLLGRIFSRLLLQGISTIDEVSERIARKLDGLVAAGKVQARSQTLILKLLAMDREALFVHLFKDAFRISASGEEGWFAIDNYLLLPMNNRERDGEGGISFFIELAADAPAIVPFNNELHDGPWANDLPVMRFYLNPQASFFGYSIFECALVNKVVLESEASEVGAVLAYNQHGQLDISKPFSPFGPLPSNSAYLLLANYEAALKPLSKVQLHITWGDLPTADGGFSYHYQGYQTCYENSDFKVDAKVLQDGKWQPGAESVPVTYSLFTSESGSGRVAPQRCMELDVLNHYKPLKQRLDDEAFTYDRKVRNGFFKLQLSQPNGAFGHSEYPNLLAATLTKNAKLKKPIPLPQAPYTPVIDHISMDYQARWEMDLAHAQTKAEGDRFYHIHPFGVESRFPGQDERAFRLLPDFGQDGQLFIGIKARRIDGVLALFFHLAQDASQPYGARQKATLEWRYLSTSGWRVLDKGRLLSDTTEGFIGSGIVTLKIPKDATSDSSLMEPGLYWLRVSADCDLHSFCSLYGVHTQAIRVQQQLGYSQRVPQEVSWQVLGGVSGLGQIKQLGVPVGGGESETSEQWVSRSSERLRHKHRAVTEWDYERLVLAEFSEVFKVKCFANMTSSDKRPQPGKLMVVVVPYLRGELTQRAFSAQMNRRQLAAITHYLQTLSSSFSQLEVRNPVYERIQVRCAVKFASEGRDGFYVRQLNGAISDYLSPWSEVGYRVRFGWAIRCEEVISYLRGLPYVESVTDFSMLHLTQCGEHLYHLGDTVLKARSEVDIEPEHPWSLAIPFQRHAIEVVDSLKPIKAKVTGVNEMEIGSTFIITGKTHHE